MKKVLFGGTFDPVHKGHVDAVRILRRRYDRVVVMPAALSPFKTGTCASDTDRLNMLHLAFDGFDGVTVDDYEIRQGGVSYTVNTLRVYKDCDFAVGGDSMRTLSDWTGADEIRANTLIAVVGRVGADCRQSVADYVESGGRAEILGDAEKGSSEVARLQLALEGSSDLLPEKVNAYATAHNLYAHDYDDVKALFKRFHLKASRIAHTYGVAYTAMDLAQLYGADKAVCVRAALLHDVAKYVSVEEARQLGLNVTDEVLDMPEPIRHAFFGAEIAHYILHEPPEVVSAIRWHTTGRAAMTKTEQIVCLADFIEPGRNFHGVEEIRALAQTNLDRATAAMLKSTLEHLSTNHKTVDAETARAYRYYSERTL